MIKELTKPSEQLFELMIESAPIAMVLISDSGKITFANGNAERLFGYCKGELTGNRIETLMPAPPAKKSESPINLLLNSVYTNTQSATTKIIALKKDGAGVEVEIGLIAISTIDGARTLATITETGKTMGTEEALKISENRFHELFDAFPVPLSVFDLTTHTFVMNNENALNLFKLSGEEMQKKGLIDISPKFQPDGKLSAESAKEVIKEVIKGMNLNCEWTFCDSTGKEITCDLRMVTLPNAKTPQILGSFIDITERKIAEQLQSLFYLIVNSSDDAIVSKNLDGIITSWNHGAEKVFGYTAEEIIGKHISITMPAYLKSEEDVILHKILKGESIEHYETVRRKKDGEIFMFLLLYLPSVICRDRLLGHRK